MSVHADVLIACRPQAVWDVLVDLSSFPRWNPFIRKIEGVVQEGARWRAELTLDGRLYFAVPVVVVQCVPGERLAWRGGLPRLMTGLHGFALAETADGTLLAQSETFSGLFVPAVLPVLRSSLQRRFVEMNEALRSEVARRGCP